MSKNFELETVYGEGNGAWGQVPFGESTWGGEGSDSPIRVLVPRNKQRCRYIYGKFVHKNAREIFQIFGISFQPNITSERGYRT